MKEIKEKEKWGREKCGSFIKNKIKLYNFVRFISVLQAKRLTPDGAYHYIKCKRPHILLAPRQWEAIKLFHKNLTQDNHDATL